MALSAFVERAIAFGFQHRLLLSEEQVADEDGGDDAGEVGQQAAGHGMARLADADRAEVDGKDVEGGVGGSLEDAAQATNEGVGTVGLHGIHHHAACAAAAERFHNGRGQCAYPVGGDAQLGEAPSHAADEPVHGSRSAEHTDAHEDGDEVGNNPDGSCKTLLRAFNESVVNVHLLAHTSQQEYHDDDEKQHVGSGCAHGVHHRAVQLREAPDKSCHAQRQSAESQEDDAVEKVDALIEAGHHDARHGGDEGGNKDGYEHIGGLRRPHLGAIDEDAHRDDGQSARVEHEEHNHRVGSRVFLRVQLL